MTLRANHRGRSSGSKRAIWQRRTYREIAGELKGISERFRAAEAGCLGIDPVQMRQVMIDASCDGIELLRALAIRGEQDYGSGLSGNELAGCLVANTDQSNYLVGEIKGIPASFKPQGVTLRDALNKVERANPARSSYSVEGDRHDLVLSGTLRSSTWVAVISLLKVVEVLRAYPDARVPR